MSRKAVPIAVVVIVVLGAGLTAYAASTSDEKRPCSLRKSRTIYRDQAIRVFSKRDSFDEDITRTYACLLSADAQVRIALDKTESVRVDIRAMHFAPPFIAFWRIGCAKADCGSPVIEVINLKTRKRRFTPARATIHGLGVTRKGSVAWMDRGRDPDDPDPTRYVSRMIRGEDPEPLDSGTDIEPSSFALGGSRVYWTKANTPVSATVP